VKKRGAPDCNSRTFGHIDYATCADNRLMIPIGPQPFGLDYRPDSATALDGRDLPLPDGFSGSLVWNTRFVEREQNSQPWNVDCAQVTGLVWLWVPDAASLVATRVEYVRSFLLRVISG
jgi:hypothetical protein